MGRVAKERERERAPESTHKRERRNWLNNPSKSNHLPATCMAVLMTPPVNGVPRESIHIMVRLFGLTVGLSAQTVG